MRIALTGATGLVGQFLAARALAQGHALVALGRAPSPHGGTHRPWRLGEPAPLADCDALIHAAFAHVPGRYRGGEGSDPQGFLRLNLDGTLRLWEDARGLPTVFLSSRAVYDGLPPGTTLTEDLPLAPDSLYGQAKLAAEAALHAQGGASLRATGVYGPPAPGQRPKWADLLDAFARGDPLPPACGTEVHGDDVAAAALLLLAAPPGPYNCSDLLLDRHDLLARWSNLTGIPGRLPPRADRFPNVMDCSRLRALGWTPGGEPALAATLRALAASRPRAARPDSIS
ncbi:NAD-dependent epimerase/dehydratase family protein [Rubellimicrobium aerolatum]|uniref:NAD-dependent epimerase/dehydratase family protein n=1 Tax=Rubellimicrobium aerolatum TaxID=490979 RepID=A0ABW0SGR0_9RHOB|nr:NAD(P)-dependent oxidoreductase [Rubellimicrobium aerolatum]MBP1805815.1 nucleoside-diphosphate-sugar epimerase [Rubellimicrobium aerolatum]